MKKYFKSGLLLSLSLLFLFPSCNKKETEDPVPSTINTGLVAHYTLNSSADDASGYNHHATIYGATLTSDRKGQSNSAYYFDGFDDFLKVTATAGLDNNNLTYCAWIKPVANPATNDYTSVISIGNIGADQAVTINNNYHSTVGVNVGGYNNTTTSSATSVNNKQLPALNEWTHVTYTRSNTDIKLYINGQQAATISTNSTLPKYNAPLLFTIGTRYSMSEGFFNGSIDEVRVYNRALSATEVEEVYKQ